MLGTVGRAKRDRKVTAFREALFKGNQSSSRPHREAAIGCVVDLSKAASFAGGRSTNFVDTMAIKSIAQDIMEEIKVRFLCPFTSLALIPSGSIP
ncbi:hypothetical protein BN14_01584 [Rhizoctonia solani AG-1 IB]|uniref:Uncharacterized protein n=1 Tax=Thanatephorus cucumeris (strain AG1-IB / isolate 7/3/14) TaxID=1108050 RepID=M5BLD0_THACB|nr:hypothetical protein BN14_01584 [Rhizoctonia solani AG-1 IB]